MRTAAEEEQDCLRDLKDERVRIVDWSIFASHVSDHVRHAAATHLQCPNEILQGMLNDKSPRIRDIARQRLQIKNMLKQLPAAE